MQAVISSAFESSIGLGQYAHLAAALDRRAAGSGEALRDEVAPGAAHGLATASWFQEDIVDQPLLPQLMGNTQVLMCLNALRYCSPVLMLPTVGL